MLSSKFFKIRYGNSPRGSEKMNNVNVDLLKSRPALPVVPNRDLESGMNLTESAPSSGTAREKRKVLFTYTFDPRIFLLTKHSQQL